MNEMTILFYSGSDVDRGEKSKNNSFHCVFFGEVNYHTHHMDQKSSMNAVTACRGGIVNEISILFNINECIQRDKTQSPTRNTLYTNHQRISIQLAPWEGQWHPGNPRDWGRDLWAGMGCMGTKHRQNNRMEEKKNRKESGFSRLDTSRSYSLRNDTTAQRGGIVNEISILFHSIL